MIFKIGNSVYLKGTKQRFKIIDRDLGRNYYLISFMDLRRNNFYKSYFHKKITKDELYEKYQLI